MATFERSWINVQVPMVLRLATRADLPKLEWYGQYTHFRRVFQKTYQDQLNGHRLMLIADSNNFPIGQVFVKLNKQDDDRHVYLYSLRVMEMFRGLGIGTQLVLEAERIARENNYEWASIGVTKDNLAARRLYERLDYQVVREDAGEWNYVDHEGRTRYVHEPCWLLEKHL
jgi:ribosomal protein S18 acetylase RimI-like enzyme